jgi:hypothetical protein
VKQALFTEGCNNTNPHLNPPPEEIHRDTSAWEYMERLKTASVMVIVSSIHGVRY